LNKQLWKYEVRYGSVQGEGVSINPADGDTISIADLDEYFKKAGIKKDVKGVYILPGDWSIIRN
jgi:hypothetical protein